MPEKGALSDIPPLKWIITPGFLGCSLIVLTAEHTSIFHLFSIFRSVLGVPWIHKLKGFLYFGWNRPIKILHNLDPGHFRHRHFGHLRVRVLLYMFVHDGFMELWLTVEVRQPEFLERIPCFKGLGDLLLRLNRQQPFLVLLPCFPHLDIRITKTLMVGHRRLDCPISPKILLSNLTLVTQPCQLRIYFLLF